MGPSLSTRSSSTLNLYDIQDIIYTWRSQMHAAHTHIKSIFRPATGTLRWWSGLRKFSWTVIGITTIPGSISHHSVCPRDISLLHVSIVDVDPATLLLNRRHITPIVLRCRIINQTHLQPKREKTQSVCKSEPLQVHKTCTLNTAWFYLSKWSNSFHRTL